MTERGWATEWGEVTEQRVFEEWEGMRLRETMKFEVEGKPSLKSESERFWEDSMCLSLSDLCFEWFGHVEG